MYGVAGRPSREPCGENLEDSGMQRWTNCMAVSTLETYEAAYFAGITEGLQGDLSACLKVIHTCF